MSQNNHRDFMKEAIELTLNDLSEKLGRTLSDEESNCVYNCGSLMFLETLGMAIHYSKSPDELLVKFADWCAGANSRYKEATKDLNATYSNSLNRDLSDLELKELRALSNLYQMDKYVTNIINGS